MTLVTNFCAIIVVQTKEKRFVKIHTSPFFTIRTASLGVKRVKCGKLTPAPSAKWTKPRT